MLQTLHSRLKKVFLQKNPVWFTLSYFYRLIVASLGLRFPFLLSLFPLSIVRNGYKLLMVPTPLSARLYRYPKYLQEDEQFIQLYLREGDVYVDVGANIGFTTLAAAVSVGESGRVYAFEPHRKIHGFLQKNLSANEHLRGRVDTRRVALGNVQDGEVFFTDYQWDDANHITNDVGEKVPVSTLDDSIRNEEEIDLLKIDVEGFEKFVLEGARETLRKTKTLYFEVCENNYSRYDYDFSDVYDLLEREGFSVYKISTDNSSIMPIDASYRPKETFENLLAIKDSDRTFFLERTGARITGKS